MKYRPFYYKKQQENTRPDFKIVSAPKKYNMTLPK